MNKKEYCTNKETEKALKISSCDLMHLRVKGALSFTKKGNAFLYKKDDIEKLKQS
ncbi:helix-turn-helix domain-containing protein [Seonamhaeicola aphaedonensis]|uniref:Helix-turn-helix protein n=1 Tax=Seonamhaeicola aphaedonensis TaxID=1461338 RepID=A0A3D9H5B7_9FLAO|nr:helix-turn-helix domain-containing protein [Seonamhaeicola aphaedonensis]RED44708.1 hypothetical protein DFQ02_11010 [Seonamhaeicola aphaedonensis]